MATKYTARTKTSTRYPLGYVLASTVESVDEVYCESCSEVRPYAGPVYVAPALPSLESIDAWFAAHE